MFINKITPKPALAILALLAAHPGFAADTLVDSAAIEFGTGSKVKMIRISAQSNWERSWFSSNGTHLSGYWDANLAQWRGTRHRDVPGQDQDITVVGLTPVFRFERTDKRGWYAEGGIGVSLWTELYNNDGNQLSTAFQFADHIGAGYVFDNKWDIGAKIQHFSNGGIKKPNSGVNLLVVKATYRF